ncbi:Chitinase 4 [Tilletia horrida]|uniref:Chitinase 4 n=1 Tax=Tilletia horrida TaxID=155126 RepID=A0AAN6JTJ6_9BASI|nr:Chitinase 4 [Tilletia horrida]KAK0567838.1 Chitinase 4 [Tilletia horrida]
MLSFLKSHSWAVLLAFFSLQLLVAASPLDQEDEKSPFWDRATGTGKYVGSTCSADSECFSGLCQLVAGTTKKVCARQPLGGPCFRGGNCETRHCDRKAGKCAPKLNPTDVCDSDLSCTSGRCISSISNRDQYGEIQGPNFKQLHGYKECDYLRVNQKGCRNYLDCYDSPCGANGYCLRAQTGQRCQFSYHCALNNLCSRDGFCYVPNPKAQADGNVCNGNDQCTSGNCHFGYKNNIPRPWLANLSQTINVGEAVCEPAPTGYPYPYPYYGYGKK